MEKTEKKFDGSLVLALSAAVCLCSIAIAIPAFVKIKDRNDKGVIAATAAAADGASRAAAALETLAENPRGTVVLLYLCRKLPPLGEPSWASWVEKNGDCVWAHTGEAYGFNPGASRR